MRRRPSKVLVFAALLTTHSSAIAAMGTPRPSFPCEQARTLDEIAICSDVRLSELDRLQAAAFTAAKRRDARQAIKDAKARLERRSLCANDRECLLTSMAYSGDFPPPPWLESYRKVLIKEVLRDDLSLRSYGIVGKQSSFPTGSKGEQATLSQIDGVDTDRASAEGRFTQGDLQEYCERDPGGMTIQHGGKLTIGQCIQEVGANRRHRTLKSSANCKAKHVTLWDGTWRFLKYEEFGITWLDPKGAVTEPYAGTVAAEAQFQLLCPNTFARVRADAQDREARSH